MMKSKDWEMLTIIIGMSVYTLAVIIALVGIAIQEISKMIG